MTSSGRSSCPTAVLFLTFNRPETTRQVFRQIRRARPATLFVASDGPREGVPGEEDRVQEIRHWLPEAIDWECKVRTLYRDRNLGCKRAVIEAVTWFLEAVEEGIIVEDDCLPHPSFFGFCGDLLERYRHNPRVMMISGNNFQEGIQRGSASYYFSRYSHIWGWATWRRAWALMDADLETYDAFKSEGHLEAIFDPDERDYWRKILDSVQGGRIDTWDYQWLFSVLSQGGLSATPNKNLVSNIGFGGTATHTGAESANANLPRHDLGPIVHPDFVLRHHVADRFTFDTQWKREGWRARIRRALGRAP